MQKQQPFAYRLFGPLIRFWIKPGVLPELPQSLINTAQPTLYVLESGGLANRLALTIAAENPALPSPEDKLIFADIRENASATALPDPASRYFRRNPGAVPSRLSRLVSAGLQHPDQTLQIIPVSVYWGRAPDKEWPLFKYLFSESWTKKGRLEKLLTVLIHGRNTLVSFSQPVALNTLYDSTQNPEVLARKLSRILRVHFRHHRIASLGPDLSHRRTLISQVLADRTVKQAVVTEAANQNRTRNNKSSTQSPVESDTLTPSPKAIATAEKKAHKFADEIAANMSYPAIRIGYRLLRKLWNDLYDGVEVSGVERLKSVSEGREIIYVPCHRSHIDYLLLSYILYVQGLSLPHIAAGINLNLPIVGGLLRRGGAFFLRRSFAGQALYATVFNAYLKRLLQRGHALEYFIEGGRSRTGRLLPPKGGMLSMTVNAYLQKPETPVVFIPVYFGYERLLEGRAFTSELAGGKKQRESIISLIRSLRTLRGNYGRVYVSFCEPIALDELLSQHQPNWQDNRAITMPPVIDALGRRIMHNINASCSVTPISLLALVLLATPQGHISEAEFIRQIKLYTQLMHDLYADSLITLPELQAETLAEHGQRLGFIDKNTDQAGTLLSISSGQRAPLTYFRNNIIHLLALPALIAAAFMHRRDRSGQEIHHLVTLTLPFVAEELFMPETPDDLQVTQCLQALCNNAMLHKQDTLWVRSTAGSFEAMGLARLAQTITPTFERYYLSACMLVEATQNRQSTVNQQALSSLCETAAARLALTHGRYANDLFDQHLHQTLIKTLQQQGYIEQDGDSIRPDATLFTMEAEARELLSEPMRHAILSICREVI